MLLLNRIFRIIIILSACVRACARVC